MNAVKEFISSAGKNFADQLSDITITDVIDIFIVTIILFYVIRFIRDRRAGRLAVSIVLLVVLQVVSNIFNMSALQFIMQNVFQMGLLALIIVFQPELRTMLENMGGDSLKGLKSIGEQKDVQSVLNMISDLCEALCDLSKDKTGALVVIEMGTKLGDIIKSGTVVNADMSPFLLKNIFFNKAPLHDGAVIIRGGRIYAAGCLLPLSTNTDIIKDLGTRHRAAIGMSENSDAIVLVVSEETGTISLARNGQLKRNFDYTSLRLELEQLLTDTSAKKKTTKRKDKTDENNEGGEA